MIYKHFNRIYIIIFNFLINKNFNMCKFSKKFLKNHKKMDKKRKFLLKTHFKYFKNNLFLKKSDSMFSPHNTSQFIIKNTNNDCEIENGNFDYENLFFLNNLNSSNEIFIDSKNGDDNCNLSTDNSSINDEMSFFQGKNEFDFDI